MICAQCIKLALNSNSDIERRTAFLQDSDDHAAITVFAGEALCRSHLQVYLAVEIGSFI